MANAAVAYENLADDGSVSASSQNLLLPATNVQTPHIEERWRSVSSVSYLIADLGSAQSIDTPAVFGMTVGDNATARARVSLTDPAGETGIVYDSGTVASGSMYFDAEYGAFVPLIATPVSGRYVRFDFNDPDGTYVEAGRLFIGLRTQFDRNFAFGWALGLVDRSVRAKVRGGQTLVWNDNQHRTLDLTFDALSASQRYGVVETIDRLNGQHSDVLFMIDPDSDNVARDSIWGLITDLMPNTNPSVVDVFGRQYRIEERL